MAPGNRASRSPASGVAAQAVRYLKSRFVARPRIGVEAVIYSVAFGLLAGWFLS
jgi:hypothetical protein